MPNIAHLRLANGAQHFVVVERADASSVWVMDPAVGERRRDNRRDFNAQWTGVLLLLAPDVKAPMRSAVPTTLERVWTLARPHRGALAQALLGALVYTTLGLATSIYVRYIVDSVLAEGRQGVLRPMSVAMLGVVVGQTVIGSLRSLLTTQAPGRGAAQRRLRQRRLRRIARCGELRDPDRTPNRLRPPAGRSADRRDPADRQHGSVERMKEIGPL